MLTNPLTTFAAGADAIVVVVKVALDVEAGVETTAVGVDEEDAAVERPVPPFELPEEPPPDWQPAASIASPTIVASVRVRHFMAAPSLDWVERRRDGPLRIRTAGRVTEA
jgi:hypothetical protein